MTAVDAVNVPKRSSLKGRWPFNGVRTIAVVSVCGRGLHVPKHDDLLNRFSTHCKFYNGLTQSEATFLLKF